jgi:hypothetical protein
MLEESLGELADPWNPGAFGSGKSVEVKAAAACGSSRQKKRRIIAQIVSANRGPMPRQSYFQTPPVALGPASRRGNRSHDRHTLFPTQHRAATPGHAFPRAALLPTHSTKNDCGTCTMRQSPTTSTCSCLWP